MKLKLKNKINELCCVELIGMFSPLWERLFKHEYQTDKELLNMLLQIQSPVTI